MSEAMQTVGRFFTSPKGLLLGLFVLVPLAFFALGGGDWFSLEGFRAHRDQIPEYAARHFWPFLILWGLLYTATVAFSIPGGALLSLVKGFLFGRWGGTLLIVVSAALGAVTVFAAARCLFAEAARQRLEPSPVASKLLAGLQQTVPGFVPPGAFASQFVPDELVQQKAVSYLLFLRLVPVFPFWLVNLAPAFTPVTLRTYALATGGRAGQLRVRQPGAVFAAHRFPGRVAIG